jgi:hypothetical protein
MSESVLGFSIQGADDVSRHLASVATSLGQLTSRQQASAQASRQMASSGRAATQSFGQMVQQGQQLTQKVQGVSSAVQSLVGQMGGQSRTAGLVASVAANVSQFASLGAMLGPGGAVAGGIIGLVGGLSSLIDHQRESANVARDHAEALAELATAASNARAATARSTSRADVAAASSTTNADERRLALAGRDDSELRQFRDENREAINELERMMADNALLRSAIESGASEIRSTITGAEEANELLSGRTIAGIRGEITALENEIETRHMVAAATATQSAAIEEQNRLLEASIALADRIAADEEAKRQAREERGRAAREAMRQARMDAWQDVIDETDAVNDELLDLELAAQAERDAVVREGREAAERARDAAWQDVIDATNEVNDELLDLELARADALIEKQREVAEQQEELRHNADNLAQAFSTGLVTSLDEVADAWREANRAARAAGTGMISTGALMERSLVAVGNNIADTVGGTMLGAFEKALGAWLDGSKSFVEAAEEMAKGVLRSLVIESIVQAVAETARGIAGVASSYGTDPTAYQHFAAAAAWAAVGVAAGAVGAGVGAFGGGGGGSAPQAATSREMAGNGRESRGGDSYVINVYPGMLSTGDEVSAGLVDGLNRAARNGRTVDSRLLRGGR